MEIDFALLHFPVPHAPHVYNMKTGKFTRRNSPIAAYVDSLALTDRTFGELRRSMEASGVWQNTTVLVSSDHPYREAALVDGRSDPRIPFILKMAGKNQGYQFAKPFNTVNSKDLLLAILKGKVNTSQEVADWLTKSSQKQSSEAP